MPFCLHEILSGEGVPEIFVQQGLAAVEGHFIPTMTGSPSTRNPKRGVATEKQTQLQRRDEESDAADAGAEHDGDPRWRRRKYMILYADLLSSNVNCRCYKKETKKFEQKEPLRESTGLISIESKVDVEEQRKH